MKFLTLFVFIASFGMGIGQSNAQETVTFGPRETKIIGSIPYTVIGKYRAQFSAFKGSIALDGQRIESVYLEIEAKSIKSNCPWCDRAARSRKLLNTARYPQIIFKSDKIIHNDRGYKVRGILEMHGIKKRMIFPFTVEIINDPNTGKKLLAIKGSWAINRKDFNIVWNKYLDRGGVLVGDYFTVDWGIRFRWKDS
jgi:polyisoprenoid-binding protein YceI